MEVVFLKILNMSITASWIVLAVIAARFLLGKAPKWITVLLWGMVGIRLACPFAPESVFSLIPSAETVPGNLLYTDAPTIHSGVTVFNSMVNPIISESLAPAVGASANPMQTVTFIASIIWIAGIAAMLVYTAVSCRGIHKKVREAIPFKDNIWLCDRVDTPFVLGVIRPRIFIPSAVGEQDMKYVIAHEKAHLKRRDHWWKPLGFLLLTVYWFNPILWGAYILLCRDIELACDEKVIRDMGTENKKQYSDALINCSAPRRMIAACPLAFGEVNVKGRVKSVLNYKKPAFWIIIVAVIFCAVVAVCFLTNPKNINQGKSDIGGATGQQQQLKGEPSGSDAAILENINNGRTDSDKVTVQRPSTDEAPDYYALDASNGLDVYVWQMAKDSYSFGLLPHSDTPRNWTSSELLRLRGTDADEMREILATYNIDEKNIHIIPWQNPISSYIPGPWIISKDGSREVTAEDYIDFVREMLFGE